MSLPMKRMTGPDLMTLPIPGPVPRVTRVRGSAVVDGPIDTHVLHNSEESVPEMELPPPSLAPSPYGVALAAPEDPALPPDGVPAPPIAPPAPDGGPPPANPIEEELLRGMMQGRKTMPPLGAGGGGI